MGSGGRSGGGKSKGGGASAAKVAKSKLTLANAEAIGDEDTRAIRDAMSKFSGNGASDTEPRSHAAHALRRAASGLDPQVPTSVRDWELFPGTEGVGAAVRALRKTTTNVARKLQRMAKSRSGRGKLTNYLKGVNNHFDVQVDEFR